MNIKVTDTPISHVGLGHVTVAMMCDGMVLQQEVMHRFENASANAIEVIYRFPVASAAIILGLEVDLDGRLLLGVLSDNEDAEDIFEATQESLGFAATLERTKSDLCTLNLGRLPPGATATTRTSLAAFLEVIASRARIVVPTVATFVPSLASDVDVGVIGVSSSLLAQHAFGLRLTLTGPAATANVSSPTHGLAPSREDGQIVFTLGEAATLDRDVVIVLDGLPDEQAARVSAPGCDLCAVASAPLGTVQRQPIKALMLLDASGSLGPITRDAEEVIELIVAGLHPGDDFAVAKIGRRPSPWPALALMAGQSPDLSPLGGLAADLGELPHGSALEPLGFDQRTDLLIITDGHSRSLHAVVEQASLKKCRVFVLALGSAPAEGWLRGAANASGGDFAACAPAEDLAPAVDQLLNAMTLSRVGAPHLHWEHQPAWTAEPTSWRFARRDVVCAGFDHPPFPTAVTIAKPGGDDVRLVLHSPDSSLLANAAIKLAATRRLAHITRADQRRAWASRLGLATWTSAWIATTALAATGGEAARLIETPQMVRAGWRGLGSLGRAAQISQEGSSGAPKPSASMTSATAALALLGLVAAGASWSVLLPTSASYRSAESVVQVAKFKTTARGVGSGPAAAAASQMAGQKLKASRPTPRVASGAQRVIGWSLALAAGLLIAAAGVLSLWPLTIASSRRTRGSIFL